MSLTDVIVFGGYGTFGTHLVRELAAAGCAVTIAGRNRERALRAARSLGGAHQGIAADASNPASCREALVGQHVAVNAAGPFAELQTTLLDVCHDVGCHYVDISDDRQYVASVRARTGDFSAAGLTAAYGCSSLPGISGAVAAVLCEEIAAPVDHARITLFIGNRNPKGVAAVRSAAAAIGRPIQAPQGVLIGFGDPERVTLEPPFHRRQVLNFNSPDYDEVPRIVPLGSLRVKVGFELPGVTAAFRLSARYFPRLGRWTFPRLAPWSGWLGWLGSSGGQVLVELFTGGDPVARGAVVAKSEGQRLAALPAVYVTRQLCRDEVQVRGAVTAYEAIGARRLIDLLVADGYEFRTDLHSVEP